MLMRESLTRSSRLDNDQKIRLIALKVVPAKAKSIYSWPIQARAALSRFIIGGFSFDMTLSMQDWFLACVLKDAETGVSRSVFRDE